MKLDLDIYLKSEWVTNPRVKHGAVKSPRAQQESTTQGADDGVLS